MEITKRDVLLANLHNSIQAAASSAFEAMKRYRLLRIDLGLPEYDPNEVEIGG